MNKPRILTAGIAALLALPATVTAVERSWIANPGDGVWGNAANWDANGVPVSGVNDRIFVHTPGSVAGVAIDAQVLFMAVGTAGAPASGYTFGAGTYNIGTIFVGEGHVGNGHGPAPINNNFGRAFIDAGTTINAGSFHLGEWDGAGGHVVQTGGDVNLAGQFRLGHWPQAGGAQNSYTMSGGTITMTGGPGDGSEGSGGAFILGIDSSGTFTLNGGTVNSHGITMQTRGASGGQSFMNVNGGTLNVGVNGFKTTDANNLGAYDINLGGGTVRATANWSSALEMHVVSGGTGIIFDTNGNTVTLNGQLNGLGGLTKSGAGTLALGNNSNSYSGPTTISAGTLRLTAVGVLPTSAITVQTGAGLRLDTVGKTLLSLAIESGSTLSLGTAVAQTITVTNALTFTGVPNFTVRPLLTSAPALNDTFDLLTAGSVLGTVGTITTDFGLSHAQGTTALVGNKLVLTITAAGGNLTWSNAAATGLWNVNGDVNWQGADGKFLPGDEVNFTDLATGPITLVGTLDPSVTRVNATGNHTFTGSGTLSGATALIKSNTGTLTINTLNDYTGGTTINGGVIALTAQNGGIAAIRGTVTINAGGELRGAGGSATFGYNTGQKIDTFNVNGGLVNAPGGEHIWNATVNMTGGELRTNGGVSSPVGSAFQWGNSILNTFASGSTATLSGRMQLRSDAGNTFTLNVADGGASTDLLISAVITENGGMNITKNGAGTAEFSGGMGISGNLYSSGGALALSGATGFSANQLLMWGGSTVTLSNSAALTSDLLSFGIGGQNETIGGTLNVGPGTSVTTNYARLGDSAGGGSLTQGTLNQTGGTVSVNAPNTDGRNFVLGHWGATHGLYNLSAGTLNSPNISMAVSWDGTGAFNISGSGIANMKGVRFGNHYNNGSNGEFNLTGGQLNLGDEGIWATLLNRPTDINLGGGIVRAMVANVPITLPTELTGTNGDVLFDTNGNTLTVTGAMSGAGGFIKAGAGRMVLNAPNSAAGIFTVNAGTLALVGDQTANRLPANAIVQINNGGTLEFTSDNPAAFSVNYAVAAGGTLTNGAGVGHVHIGFVQLSGGTWTTDAASSSYNGENYSLDGGVSVVGSTPSLITQQGGSAANRGIGWNGSRTFDVADVTVSAATDLTVSTELEDTDFGAAALVKTGAGTMTLTFANSYSGGTTISLGTLQIGDGGTTGTLGSGAVTDNANLVFKRSDPLTVTNAISGTGAVTNAGGILNLNGAQNYATLNANSGTTNVNGAFTAGTATVNANAAVNFYANQTLGALNIAAGVEVTFGDGLPFAGGPGKGSAFGGATVVVPEPGSLASLALGLSLLLARRRRPAGK